MITIIFEAHGTTFDNEAHLSSGWNDVALSPLGIQQSKEMGERYKDDHFDAIFCSDLQRAYKSAEIGFGNKWPIIQDARLRECNYGDFTQHPSSEVDVEKPKRITTPFPNGESYEQTTARMKSFLEDLKKNYDGKRVMVIGHRATQYGLDHLINGVTLEQLTSSHFKWQPGWEYRLGDKSENNKKWWPNLKWPAISLAGLGALYIIFKLTVYAPQTMHNSPGGMQIQGDGNKIDTPAEYSYRSEIKESKDLPGWPYALVITLDANKDVHLPQRLCLALKTDTAFKQARQFLMNYDAPNNNTSLSVGYGYDGCISGPSSKVIATYYLKTKTDKIDLSLSI